MSSAGAGCSIASLTAEQCTYEHFRTHHLAPNVPCIFHDSLVQHFALFDTWIKRDGQLDMEYLEKTYGSLKVDCIDCREDELDERERVSTFAQLLHLWHAGEGRSKYLKDWHLPLEIQLATGSTRKGKEKLVTDLYEVPHVCLDDWMNEFEGTDQGDSADDFRFVYAGGRNTFTPLHRDVYCSYSISTQIYGRKLWYLFPPACTALLEPLITTANRQGTGVNCDEWPEEKKTSFRDRGMITVYQEARQTIFIPSGWYHSVHNSTHPTLSLNHNWLNSHNLPAIYDSLSQEVARCREAISDVKDLLVKKAERDSHQDTWKQEWEQEVDGLVERSEGWSWTTFWRMTLNTLEALELSRPELEARFERSRWPLVPPEARPATSFVVQQVKPLLQNFRQRTEQECKWLDGLEQILLRIDTELARLNSTG
ncbi:uncharacterized protein JCM15063_001576 [Sporobolomyces koalae]|uniref:uncharacterized protein n=1 Tax=Sporobolomyces koalae TaxID=500713 RepID=UPI00316E0445